MSSDHLTLLTKLINGVLSSEDRTHVLCWSSRFAELSASSHTQHMLRKYRTEKCSVCAFVSRCCVIEANMCTKVQSLDNALHSVGIHLPVNWTMVCIVGGILIDVYRRSVNVDLESWFLQPGDIVHHYMICSECLYHRDGPMVAIRDACSFISEHLHVHNEASEDNDDSIEMNEIVEENGAHEASTKSLKVQKPTDSLIDGIMSMINGADVSPGRCQDMAYIYPEDKDLAEVMRFPHWVMLGMGISNQTAAGEDMNRSPMEQDSHDNLYDIYQDLSNYMENEWNVECLGTERDSTEYKRQTIKLGTYEWMRALVNKVMS